MKGVTLGKGSQTGVFWGDISPFNEGTNKDIELRINSLLVIHISNCRCIDGGIEYKIYPFNNGASFHIDTCDCNVA